MASIPRWLPNAISALRIALVPVWAMFAELAHRTATEGGDPGVARAWAVGVLLAIGASDVVDGAIARHFGLQSRVGATLDAVADKLAQVVLVTYLALRVGPAFASIPPWFLLLLIVRDVVLSIGTLLVRARVGRVDVEHRVHGKLASVLLFVLLVAYSSGHGGDVTDLLLAAIAALVAWSALCYVRDGLRQVRGKAD